MMLMQRLSAYLQLLRPQQWIKNVLIFAPAFFAGTAMTLGGLMPAVYAFIAVSCVASAVYIVNDAVDCAQDAKHPTKRYRPLPAGIVTLPAALVLAGVVLMAGFGVAGAVPTIIPFLVGYVVLNSAYSAWLKHVAVIDIALVAFFYVLRIVIGGVAAAVPLSPWIILATFFLALFLVTGKRRAENLHVDKRAVLEGYAPAFLDGLLLGAAVLSLASYGLWAVLVQQHTFAVYSVMPVTVVVLRVLNTLYRSPEQGEVPESMVFKDRWVLGFVAVWVLLMDFLFYL